MFNDYNELINRDKASLDIFWLKDESLEEAENLPEPGILAQEIVEDLEAGLEKSIEEPCSKLQGISQMYGIFAIFYFAR